jgi:hypothetical protein
MSISSICRWHEHRDTNACEHGRSLPPRQRSREQHGTKRFGEFVAAPNCSALTRWRVGDVYRSPAAREPVPVGLECPWCRRPAMGRVGKYLAGVKWPFIPSACRECGERVAVRPPPTRQLWRELPLALLLVGAMHLVSEGLRFPLCLVAVVAGLIIHNRTPLVRDDWSTASSPGSPKFLQESGARARIRGDL